MRIPPPQAAVFFALALGVLAVLYFYNMESRILFPLSWSTGEDAQWIHEETEEDASNPSDWELENMATPPLTLLGKQPGSVPFSTKWKPLNFTFSPEMRARVYATVGSDDNNPTECTSPNRTSLAVRMISTGFGSRMLNLINYMLVMSTRQTYYRFFFIPVSNYNKGRPIHEQYNALQSHFERVFALSSDKMNCDVFETKCLAQSKDGRCYSNGYVQRSASGKPFTDTSDRNLVKYNMIRDLLLIREENFPRYSALKIQLTREAMRLREEYAEMLNLRVAEHYNSASASLPHAFTVAIHIRRSDKLWSEAEFVHSRSFVRALMEVNKRHNKENRPLVLSVMTDDCRVKHEFTTELKKAKFQVQSLLFRCEQVRPDRATSRQKDEQVFDAFFAVLIDLKIMTDANVFIGSQTS